MISSKSPSKRENAKYITPVVLCPFLLLPAQLRKVCRLFNTKRKQITASILCVAMLFTLLPIMSQTASALTATPLTFTAETDGSSVTLKYSSGTDVMYNLNGAGWNDYIKGTIIDLVENDTVSFKGTDVITDYYNHFSMTGRIAASGDVTSLTNEVGGNAALTSACYKGMFMSCYSLVTAPNLPATTLVDYCYSSMFYNCGNLVTAPELPATTLADYCYSAMFLDCTSLEAAPALPATALADNCYNRMFDLCTSLKAAPVLPATTLAGNCYFNMFANCTALTEAPVLPANTLADYCYSGMFSGCTSLKAAPALPATTLADYCYGSMFSGCTSLKATPELPATTLADNCYGSMFGDCTSLTAAPVLPATTLADNCYNGMFFACTSLEAAPALPATTLADYCYSGMFFACTSLTAPPELPATTLAETCYGSMFSNCTSLETVPELPATTLAGNSYNCMFSNCKSLKAAPALPATTLDDYCYANMFSGCTSLEAAPELPATTLTINCYDSMFYGCTSLMVSDTKTGYYTIEWRISTEEADTTQWAWNTKMLSETGGTFTDDPEAGITYYIYDDITPPSVSGIEDGKTYCKKAEFTVADDGALDKVKANGAVLTAQDGTYTLTASGANTVVVTDKAGNSVTVTVTINANHTFDNNCDTTCNVCDEVRTVTHDWAAEWSSDGTNHWHECSVCGETDELSAHTPNADDGDCTTAVHCSVCDAVTAAAIIHDFSGDYDGYDSTHHWHICSNDGCNKTDAKVAHSGGTATYLNKAVCFFCGQEYGNTAPDVTDPTGSISVSTKSWNKFLNTVTFGLFFKETQTVTVTADDTESGVAKIEYLLSDTVFTGENTVTGTWNDITASKQFNINPNSKQFIYVRLTDEDGNSAIINSDGVVIYSDSTVSPVTAAFDKNVDNQTNLTFTMTLNGNTLKDIKNGTTALTSGTDYTVFGATVTVKKEYFASQGNGNVTLTFFFLPMGVENNDNLSTATATITVSDTTHYHSITHISANAPACTEDGNVEYWYCSTCGMYFSNENGTAATTLADTVLPALGHTFTNYIYNNNATYENDGTETATCDRCDVTDERTATGSKLIDTVAPTGEIKVSTNSFKEFINSITFGLFFKDSQTVTIIGADDGIGLNKVYYCKSETALDKTAVEALSDDKWIEGSTFTLSPGWQGIVYAKINDKAGNTLYISSDGLVFDVTSPVIAGVTDGGKYCFTATVLVTEANPASVTLNGDAVALTDGKFTVTAKNGAQTVIVTDKAGNKTTVTITVYTDHVWDDGKVTIEPTATEKGVKTYTCSVCGETKTDPIPMLPPSIIDGGNSIYTKGSRESLTFKSSAALANFISVSVDGKVVDKADYTTAEGSTIVTLKADYLETLSIGKHTLEIKSDSGTAFTEFTVVAKSTDPQSPPTGDSGNVVVCLLILLVTGGALTTLGITKKRKKAINK